MIFFVSRNWEDENATCCDEGEQRRNRRKKMNTGQIGNFGAQWRGQTGGIHLRDNGMICGI